MAMSVRDGNKNYECAKKITKNTMGSRTLTAIECTAAEVEC